jgi:hypothetical protein
MSSRAAMRFDTELLKLFRKRTHYLRASLWPRPGKAPQLNRESIQKARRKLQDIAVKDYIRSKDAKIIFDSYEEKRRWHPKKGKGFGRATKKRAFNRWYDRKRLNRNCVYAFWDGSKCLYVGRTLNGKGRPSSHFEKHWFGRATRLDIFAFRIKSQVPMFECMLSHHYDPVHARKKPSSKPYTAHCPVCSGKKRIKDEINRIFRLR